MKKAELEQEVADRAGLNKAQAGRALDAVLECISDALAKGDDVQLTGFGAFSVTETKARTGRNPRTGAPLDIAAGKRATFRAGQRLKQVVGEKAE